MRVRPIRPEFDRHANDELLEKYAMGAMPESDVAELEEHLLVCERCRTRLEETETYISSMKAAGRRWRDDSRGSRLPSRLVPALACAAALIVVLAAVGLWGPRLRMAAPAMALKLEATRGSILAHAPAGRPLNLDLDLVGLPEAAQGLRLVIVDAAGVAVWHGEVRPGSAVSVPGLIRGVYFVRASGHSGELLREYGLEIANP